MALQNLLGDLALEATQTDGKESIQRIAFYLEKLASLLERSDIVRAKATFDVNGWLSTNSTVSGSVIATLGAGGISTAFATANMAATPYVMPFMPMATSVRSQIITS